MYFREDIYKAIESGVRTNLLASKVPFRTIKKSVIWPTKATKCTSEMLKLWRDYINYTQDKPSAAEISPKEKWRLVQRLGGAILSILGCNILIPSWKRNWLTFVTIITAVDCVLLTIFTFYLYRTNFWRAVQPVCLVGISVPVGILAPSILFYTLMILILQLKILFLRSLVRVCMDSADAIWAVCNYAYSRPLFVIYNQISSQPKLNQNERQPFLIFFYFDCEWLGMFDNN